MFWKTSLGNSRATQFQQINKEKCQLTFITNCVNEVAEVTTSASVWAMEVPAWHCSVVTWLDELAFEWLWPSVFRLLVLQIVFELEPLECLIRNLDHFTVRQMAILLQDLHDNLLLLYNLRHGLSNEVYEEASSSIVRHSALHSTLVYHKLPLVLLDGTIPQRHLELLCK